MQNSAHNRLMREALGNADGEIPIAHSNPRAIAAAAIILLAAIALAACRADEHSMIAASTSDAYLAAANNDALTLRTQEPVPELEAQPQGKTGKKEPEGNVVDMTY